MSARPGLHSNKPISQSGTIYPKVNPEADNGSPNEDDSFSDEEGEEEVNGHLNDMTNQEDQNITEDVSDGRTPNSSPTWKRQSPPQPRQRLSPPAPRQRVPPPAPRQRVPPPQPRQRQAPPAPRQRLPSPQPNQREQSSRLSIIIGVSIVVIVVASFLYYSKPSQSGMRKQCTFNKLSQRPPLQSPDVWNALRVGIEVLLNKERSRPNVYLFMHQDQKLDKLIHDIAREASVCFDGQRSPVEMSREDFTTQDDDYGYAIEQYKKKIKNGKVLLIVNLNDIPAGAARALHTICDTYSPIAEEVVIFLTLRTSNTTAVANSAQLAADTLYNLWSQHLKDNELDPLITRVTDQILHLRSS